MSTKGERLLLHKIYLTDSPCLCRFEMPNIFSESGYPWDGDERPIVSRPPPRHPGVRVPGVRVPPNAGNIEDIIQPKPLQVQVMGFDWCCFASIYMFFLEATRTVLDPEQLQARYRRGSRRVRTRGEWRVQTRGA